MSICRPSEDSGTFSGELGIGAGDQELPWGSRGTNSSHHLGKVSID